MRCDLWDSPDHADVMADLRARVLVGWTPQTIRSEVDARCAEKGLLKEWGQRTGPESTAQFLIEDTDSWLE